MKTKFSKLSIKLSKCKRFIWKEASRVSFFIGFETFRYWGSIRLKRKKTQYIEDEKELI